MSSLPYENGSPYLGFRLAASQPSANNRGTIKRASCCAGTCGSCSPTYSVKPCDTSTLP